MKTFVIGLGSNLGDRLSILQRALARLDQVGQLRAVSALYETDPVGGPDQPGYLNAAVRLDTELTALALLEALQAIEAEFGRVRAERWGPRTLDLDVLWAEGPALDDPAIQIPHARLPERAFALAPLLDVAPAAADPRTGERYSSVYRLVGNQGIRRLPVQWANGIPSGS